MVKRELYALGHLYKVTTHMKDAFMFKIEHEGPSNKRTGTMSVEDVYKDIHDLKFNNHNLPNHKF